MNNFKFIKLATVGALLLVILNSCTEKYEGSAGNFQIGWSTVDITPDRPVLIRGQFHARVSEGIMDPITVTALAMEHESGTSPEKIMMISCDIAGIPAELLERVRARLRESIPELHSERIVLNATHTHSAPLYTTSQNSTEQYGIELDAMPPAEYLEFLSERIAMAAEDAWNNRKPGGISYGLGHAVAGHNRLQVDLSGKSNMYGSINRPEFSHIEGFEDHSVNLLYTWDKRSNLTGVMINVASPSQVSEHAFEISADYWHDVREDIHNRLGDDIYVFAQCSAAGDLSPHVMVETRAEERMQQLMFPDADSGRGTIGRRKQIAVRIADAVTSILPQMKENIHWDPVFVHRMETVELSRRLISMDDVNEALEESAEWKIRYEQLVKEIEDNPEIKEKPRWYRDITIAYTRTRRGQSVNDRYELEKIQPKMPVEIHGTRIGDIVIVTNPFELYLDYGIRIKGRSSAVQTFVVQLSNGGYGYLPTVRSVEGGAYGAVPASTHIGPEGGIEFVENTLNIINDLWSNDY